MLQGEHSAILLTFIKLPFSIKTFVLSIFKWLLKTGFTVYINFLYQVKTNLDRIIHTVKLEMFMSFNFRCIPVMTKNKLTSALYRLINTVIEGENIT